MVGKIISIKVYFMIFLLLCTFIGSCAAETTQNPDSILPEEIKAGVFGDANHDGVINEDDVTYILAIISGKNPTTRFADANQDGKVDQEDVTVIRSIINGEAKQVYVADSEDRIVSIDLPVKSIVVLSTASPAGMLRVLGEQDKVVGINKMITGDPFYPELQNKPSVGYPAPDYEAITKLKPDLVIASANPTYAYDIVEKMEPFGIKVLQLDLNGRPEQYLTELKVLGQVLGKSDKALEYADFSKSNIEKAEKIVSTIKPEDKKSVYYEFIQDYNVPGRANGIIEEAGGEHILADVFKGDFLEHKSLNIDPEEIAEKNPDVIIKDPHVGMNWSGYAKGVIPRMENIREVVMDRPAWKETNAVKNGDVYVVTRELGNERMLATVFLGKTLYPDAFKDINASAILQEWLERFPGKKYADYAVMVYTPEHILK